MKNLQSPANHYPRRLETNLFSRLNSSTKLSITVITLSYVILLTISYSLGYLVGLSFSINDVTTFMTSKTPPSQQIILTSSEALYNKLAAHCAKPVPLEFVCQIIIDRVYNGTSPYEDFIPPRITSYLLPKRVRVRGSYEVIYKNLIQSVQPKTIIRFSTSFHVSATYIANLTSQLGLETQILCLDKFLNRSVFRDLFEDIAMPYGDIMVLNQFVRNVISQNATESILPIHLSTNSASDKLYEWSIYGDLIEVDAGHDFHSAWLHIKKAYKLLIPGGVLIGHNYFSSYYDTGVRQAVRLFARANKFCIKVYGQHRMINLA